MTFSKNLSNYDRKFRQMFKDIRLLIVDLDGTLINFEKIDNAIIGKIFLGSRAVKFMDNILWKINRLDIIGNGYAGLKLRLWVYSLFSSYDLKRCKRLYGAYYERFARQELMSIYATSLRPIREEGYRIIIVTKNVYAKNVLKTGAFDMEKNIDLVVLKKNKTKQFKSLVKDYDGKVCVIGNNLSDDILNSYRIKSPYIYIGKSKFVNIIIRITNRLFRKKGVQFTNFKKVVGMFVDEKNPG